MSKEEIKIKIDGVYLVDQIEINEGQNLQGTQLIECIGKSTTKNLFLLKDTNTRIWVPFNRIINIIEEI